MTYSSMTIWAALVVIVMLGCSSKSDIEKTLTDNPDIIFNVIEKNPERFAEASMKAQMAARKLAQSKQEEESKTQSEAEFKNPRSPEIANNRAVRGPKNAQITIVEYSDFQCPYCKQGFQTIEGLRKKYGSKMRFMFKHLPLPFHPMAMPASKRFEAIAMQNPEMAYRFHDAIFNEQNKITSEGEKFLDAAAKKVGADMARMKKDMEGTDVKARIDSDMNEAKNFGMSGTPGFLVNGVSIRGAYPMPEFERIIERHLGGKREVSSN